MQVERALERNRTQVLESARLVEGPRVVWGRMVMIIMVDGWRNFGHAVSQVAKHGIVRRRLETC